MRFSALTLRVSPLVCLDRLSETRPSFLSSPLSPRLPAEDPGSHTANLSAGLGLAALDLTGLGTVDVVSGNPVSVVGGGRGDSRAGRFLDNLALSGSLLLSELPPLALLGEVRCDPDGVEEVDDADEAGQEEEVEEDAIFRGQCQLIPEITENPEGQGMGGHYIWGSKMLVSGSTTLTVPLKAWTVKK